MLTLPIHPDNGPRGRREIVLARSLAGDLPRVIARQLGCTERQVFNIKRSLRDNGELPPRERKSETGSR